MGRAHQTVNRHSGMEPHPLPLPLGEVAAQSEDGAGKQGCKALSVTFGDSSPKGGAKGLYRYATLTVLRPSSENSGWILLCFANGDKEKYGTDCSIRQKYEKTQNNTLQL